MAKVKITGHASGSGVFTITAPNSNTDRTITLPDASVTLGTDATKLPLAGGTLTGDLNFGDNVDANFGAGGDLKIYHDGNRSYVQEQGTSSLIIDTDGPEVDINSGGNAEFMGRFIKDGAVKLYYDANQKFETTATGVTVTGALTETDSAAGSVLQIVPFTSSTATNVTSSGTWTTIAASSVAITSKQANSKFLYYFDMSVESDVSANSTYNFGVIARSGTRINASQQTLSVGHDTYESSPTTVFTYTDAPSGAAGTTYTYTMQLNAQNSASWQVNQGSLAGQEGGTAIHSNGYVMEIAV